MNAKDYINKLKAERHQLRLDKAELVETLKDAHPYIGRAACGCWWGI